MVKVHIYHNTQNIAHFVQQVFHQFVGIVQTYRLMRWVIIHTKEDTAANGVGESANPLVVFVFPDSLILYVLTLVHTKLV